MNLYRNEGERLADEAFQNPGKEYRGTPFWAWNCAIDRETLDEQIETFKRMGMGGYHVHVRTGMASPYLSDEFMDNVRHCVEKGRALDMLTWLYDEDRWPSGTAGGMVTKDHPEYVAMNLLWTPHPYGSIGPVKDLGVFATGRGGNREENGTLLGAYDVALNPDGSLRAYQKIPADAPASGKKWYAYAERAVPSAWFNDQAYIDVLNKKAVERFAEITHDRYRDSLGEFFGKDIPAIFTDEPSFANKGTMDFAADDKDVFLAWTDSLEETYRAAYGESLIDRLPELFWEQPNGAVSLTRYRFHELVAELFASHYCDTLGDWCAKNGIMLSGHMLLEETLESQTSVLGEAMRCYRAFRDMPGIDMLCDCHEYNTAKQAQSAKHQQGAKAMLSELYGVTSWAYDFRGYKLQGDWQAALGVTVRVPHLTWMSMKGEAKRDYPACIGYQSPWCEQFSMIEDHFARVNTALTRGKPAVRVAVIHPIESYWLLWGPKEQTAAARAQMEAHFEQLTETLLFGNIDFDFISEARLPELCAKGGNPLTVGAMSYECVLVPELRTLRSSTLTRLKAFREAGGRLIFLGKCPDHIDARPDSAARALYDASAHASYAASELMDALEFVRDVDIRGENGARSDELIHQMRVEGDEKWLFIARGKNPECPDVDLWEEKKISVRGEYKPVLYDTQTGAIAPIAAEYENGWTVIRRDWHMHDSLLLRLIPGRSDVSLPAQDGSRPLRVQFGKYGMKIPTSKEPPKARVRVPERVEILTEEPNALLLDRAEWTFDGGEWQPKEELLRIDNLCRDALGIPRRAKYVVQPYLVKPEAPAHIVRLRFVVESRVPLEGLRLALEDADITDIVVNGERVLARAEGWYVDKAIQTVPLPAFREGENVLELIAPIGRRTNLEWCYLLGDFGVQVFGASAVLTERPQKIGFGSIVPQGFPFYTGNFKYRFEAEAEGALEIRLPKYRAALLRVAVDGKDAGRIAYAPYSVRTDALPKGKHVFEITVYGQRQNGFGQVHHEQNIYFYQSPDSWRSSGDFWLDEYQLFPLGVMKAPEIIEL